MPAVMVSAELVPTQGPLPAVVVFIDGQRAGMVKFTDWRAASAAAYSLNDDMARVIRATLRARGLQCRTTGSEEPT